MGCWVKVSIVNIVINLLCWGIGARASSGKAGVFSGELALTGGEEKSFSNHSEVWPAPSPGQSGLTLLGRGCGSATSLSNVSYQALLQVQAIISLREDCGMCNATNCYSLLVMCHLVMVLDRLVKLSLLSVVVWWWSTVAVPLLSPLGRSLLLPHTRPPHPLVWCLLPGPVQLTAAAALEMRYVSMTDQGKRSHYCALSLQAGWWRLLVLSLVTLHGDGY